MPASTKPIILCVDDDPNILAALERDLRDDFAVHVASSIDAAEKLLPQLDEAIVLSDLDLGAQNGLEWLRSLSERRPTFARVLITGRLDWDLFSRALDEGVIQRLVQKPWDPLALRLQMKEAFQSYRLLNENRTLTEVAMTDAVTELANHRHFQETLAVEFERAARHGRKLSLVMIDVDHFKDFNDEHGHQAGDRVLKDIADGLKASVRTIDLVARYGGDEFAILLPDTDLTAARLAAERAHEEIIVTTRATISLGVADSTGRSSATDLLAAADRALYEAKAAGRNQIIVAG